MGFRGGVCVWMGLGFFGGLFGDIRGVFVCSGMAMMGYGADSGYGFGDFFSRSESVDVGGGVLLWLGRK